MKEAVSASENQEQKRKNLKNGQSERRKWNRRKSLIVWLIIAVVFLTAVCIGGNFCSEAAKATDFSRKNLPPCLKYPFGTD